MTVVNLYLLVWREKILYPSMWAVRTLPVVRVYGYASFNVECPSVGMRKPATLDQDTVFHDTLLI